VTFGRQCLFGALSLLPIAAIHAADIQPLRHLTRDARSEAAPTGALQPDGNGMLPFLDIVQPSPVGYRVVTLSGLPALPQASFMQTSCTFGTTQKLTMAADPQPDAVYTLPGTGKQVLVFPTVRNHDGFLNHAPNGRLQIIEVDSPDAPGLTLYAGVDTNGDGQPQAGEQTCRSITTGGSGVARCVVDLGGVDQAVWAIVQASAGSPGVNYAVNVTNAQPGPVPPGDSSGVCNEVTPTGPGHVAVGAAFPLRLAWDSSFGSAGRIFGAVMIDGAPGLGGASGLLPFGITSARGHNDVSKVAFWTLLGFVEPGESATHNIFDVPAGLSSLSVRASGNRSISVDVIRVPYPDFSASPDIAGAPAGVAPIVSFATDVFHTKDVSLPVEPGRLYFVVHGTGQDAVQYYMQFFYAAAAPKFVAPGAYYNPRRSGDGIFVSQAGDQHALNWYTYLEDGTPVWYVAQDIQDPHAANWAASLERVTWNGSKAGGRTYVGIVSLTYVDENAAIFSWYLEGQSGSERVSRVGTGPCPQFNGVETSFNGAWYPPALSGSGMDIAALPGLQFATFYFYDDLGNPVWASGATQPFAASSTMTLNQNQGFCPACAYVAVTSQPIGNLDIDYSGQSAGHASAQLVLRPPLSGTWQMDLATARLTFGAVCAH
jgi:hypothetical protein